MESELCVSKKQSRYTECKYNGHLPEITYRDFDHDKDFSKVCMLYWEFYLAVLKKDLSREITIQDGLKILEVESHVSNYLAKGCEIVLAFSQDDPVGILIYHRVYSQMVCAWVGYVKPEFEHRGVGIGILRAITPRPKKIIFQTLNANTSDRILKITEGDRVLLHKEPIHSTWMVDLKE